MKKITAVVCALCAVLVLCGFFCGNFLSVQAQEENENGDLNTNIEDILQDLDVEALQEYLDSLTQEQRDALGGDISEVLLSLVTGDYALDYDSALSALAGMVFDKLSGLLPSFCVICSISILCGILGRFKSSFSEKGTSHIIFFVGYCTVLVLILTSLAGVIKDCADTVFSLQKQMQAIFPILLTLIATSGGSVSVAVYRPAVLFLSESVVSIIVSVVFPLASLMCVLNMVGNMSGELKLKNFCAFFVSVIKWTLGLSLTAFTVFLSVQGITSATYDGFSFKAAKYAVSNTVPIIGSFLGSGFDLVIAGSVLIKNSLGACGIFLLVIVIMVPLVQLIAYNLFLKLAAAVTEPVGDEKVSSFLSSLSGTVNYFTAGLLAVGFMYFITILLLICSSNALF